jgi:hypothetical protein
MTLPEHPIGRSEPAAFSLFQEKSTQSLYDWTQHILCRISCGSKLKIINRCPSVAVKLDPQIYILILKPDLRHNK